MKKSRSYKGWYSAFAVALFTLGAAQLAHLTTQADSTTLPKVWYDNRDFPSRLFEEGRFAYRTHDVDGFVNWGLVNNRGSVAVDRVTSGAFEFSLTPPVLYLCENNSNTTAGAPFIVRFRRVDPNTGNQTKTAIDNVDILLKDYGVRTVMKDAEVTNIDPSDPTARFQVEYWYNNNIGIVAANHKASPPPIPPWYYVPGANGGGGHYGYNCFDESRGSEPYYISTHDIDLTFPYINITLESEDLKLVKNAKYDPGAAQGRPYVRHDKPVQIQADLEYTFGPATISPGYPAEDYGVGVEFDNVQNAADAPEVLEATLVDGTPIELQKSDAASTSAPAAAKVAGESYTYYILKDLKFNDISDSRTVKFEIRLPRNGKEYSVTIHTWSTRDNKIYTSREMVINVNIPYGSPTFEERAVTGTSKNTAGEDVYSQLKLSYTLPKYTQQAYLVFQNKNNVAQIFEMPINIAPNPFPGNPSSIITTEDTKTIQDLKFDLNPKISLDVDWKVFIRTKSNVLGKTSDSDSIDFFSNSAN